jgi:hypothetical protein
MRAAAIKGKTIKRVVLLRVEWNGRKRTAVDAIEFTDGSVLRFIVLALERGSAVGPVYPAREIEGGERMKPATERAYRAWQRAANREGPRHEQITELQCRLARIVRLKQRYERLLARERGRCSCTITGGGSAVDLEYDDQCALHGRSNRRKRA